MNTARKGRKFEYEIRDLLESQGYDVARFAASKTHSLGPLDLLAIHPALPWVVLVSCKWGAWPGKDEMKRLRRTKERHGRHEIRIYRRRNHGKLEMRLV